MNAGRKPVRGSTLIRQKQLIHVEGSKDNLNAVKTRKIAPSCFTIGLDDVQELVGRYAGHGTPDQLELHEWSRKEICVTDHIVGYVVTADGKHIPTRAFKIHYSDNGVHAVPKYDDGEEPDDLG